MKIAVIGDGIYDDYEFYESTGRKSPETGVPIVRKCDSSMRVEGGALAVAHMALALGGEVENYVQYMMYDSYKTRVYVDGVQVFRCDDDNIFPLGPFDMRTIVENLSDGEERIILFADYGKLCWSPEFWQMLVATGHRIIVDPARGRPWAFYKGAWGIVPNRDEAGVDGEYWMASTAAMDLMANDFQYVCVKLDREGMLVAWNSQRALSFETCKAIDIPSVAKLPIVDCCGAGDGVLAGIGVALARGADWFEACRYGNAVAGAVCGKVGAVPVTSEEVEELLNPEQVFTIQGSLV